MHPYQWLVVPGKLAMMVLIFWFTGVGITEMLFWLTSVIV
jgi:hypothetical protein